MIKSTHAVQNRKLAEIWCDWNERKITGDEAMYKLRNVYPRVIQKAWMERQK